jgi:hypothetical protein
VQVHLGKPFFREIQQAPGGIRPGLGLGDRAGAASVPDKVRGDEVFFEGNLLQNDLLWP